MELNNYETVFILTPVLSEAQMKDTVEKFKQVLKDQGAQIINEENWGLKKLAYPINHKTTGFYTLIEFNAKPTTINTLEIEYKRDERVMRFLTVSLDKHAVAYNNKRRKGEFKKSAEKQEEKA
ncbi:MAG: 30S ribosomal protein S6 [Sporocytophaga sp.]|jgi:small subunit ribosomal protein S6|uniref:Small ribosomal subunit protein bS6 n=1 Tax=Sporocytophaga myxococcoides TaxID=153721 RepID=A0A098LG98_9BACT|nr:MULTISPECIES: 30S ribosomal protein S6 [Sporocytophaga]MBO9701360.1 30S ribosomal protein S6 [Sporocytophaga sp.]GAL85118.1 SSU ribosomal protein S6p [Sporocytophaga myxococcoides]